VTSKLETGDALFGFVQKGRDGISLQLTCPGHDGGALFESNHVIRPREVRAHGSDLQPFVTVRARCDLHARVPFDRERVGRLVVHRAAPRSRHPPARKRHGTRSPDDLSPFVVGRGFGRQLQTRGRGHDDLAAQKGRPWLVRSVLDLGFAGADVQRGLARPGNANPHAAEHGSSVAVSQASIEAEREDLASFVRPDDVRAFGGDHRRGRIDLLDLVGLSGLAPAAYRIEHHCHEHGDERHEREAEMAKVHTQLELSAVSFQPSAFSCQFSVLSLQLFSADS
jgi:hypothetical protein